MSPFVVGFLVGFFVGGMVGFLGMALLVAASDPADRR